MTKILKLLEHELKYQRCSELTRESQGEIYRNRATFHLCILHHGDLKDSRFSSTTTEVLHNRKMHEAGETYTGSVRTLKPTFARLV